MFLLTLLFLSFHETHGYGVKVQGKMEVSHDLAIIFQDLLDQYVQINRDTKTEIDLTKLFNIFQDAVNDPTPQKANKNNNNREQGNDKKEKKQKNNKRNKELEAKDTGSEEIERKKETKKKKLLEEAAGSSVVSTDIKSEKKEVTKEKKLLTKTKNNNIETRDMSDEAIKENIKESTLLEKIVGNPEKYHLNGKHKKEANMPLNNINV